MRVRVGLSLLLIACGLAACAKPPPVTTASVEPAGKAQSMALDLRVGNGAESTVSAAAFADSTTSPKVDIKAAANGSGGNVDDYRVAPLDVVEVAVFGVPDLGGTFPVNANGTIDMPLIGAVSAGGKTLDQLKADITNTLGDKYLQSPKVTVAIKDPVSQRITVGGAVSKPGVYPSTGRTTLLQVMAMAGGLDKVADPRGVLVFRDVAGKRQVAKFDYKAISAGSANDPVIVGGDVVMVDESGGKAAMRNLRDSLGLFGLFAPLVPLI